MKGGPMVIIRGKEDLNDVLGGLRQVCGVTKTSILAGGAEKSIDGDELIPIRQRTVELLT
eukprot:m.202311 g.202311  ORF g.202311 m.202311 type:complete len:60 (+) comp39609_c0_seq5:802-981(+)